MSVQARLSATVVIPCLNEEESIGGLVEDIAAVRDDPATPIEITMILVVDNGSTDDTALVARQAGACIITEPRRGYGRACLSGVLASGPVDYIVLMDGDRSDVPDDLPKLLEPLLSGDADLVVGSRTLGSYEKGSLHPQQIAGNKVAALLARWFYGVRLTDIGPFRVIRKRNLLELGMREMTYGWSIEMIIRAKRKGLTVTEVPVRYRRRAGGSSKVSGNLKGTVKAGYRIIAAIFRARKDDRPLPDGLAAWQERHAASDEAAS
ncbi:MAG TPA: glycosyltransferase family 2 protein [Thermomicrobiales bacterium]|nr:glycosyltransferase family 2 protein [Thermomicrobiales bacterium]